MLMQCPICGEGVIAKFTVVNFPNWVAGRAGYGGITMLQTYPITTNTELPLHVPEHICGFYSQAKDNVARKNWDAAGIMFRKTLDASLKTLDPGKNGTLFQRINGLPSSLGLSDAMKECAHEIRRLGADAAHEDDPFSEEEVMAIQSFTELFLTYSFTLPGMLAARKATITSSTD